MIELKYVFTSYEELLAHVARNDVSSVAAAQSADATITKASKGAKATPTPAPAPVTLTATQTAAVDDTAGVGNVNNPPARATAPAPTAATAEAGQAGAQETKADASAKPVAYPELQAAVFKLAAVDRQAVKDLIAQFGVDSFKTLDPSKYADALKAVTAKQAELEVA